MALGVADAAGQLWQEGQDVSLNFSRSITDPTTGTLTWNIPANAQVYYGIVISAALKEINPSNYPTNGVRYTPSSNLAVGAANDMLGNAQVVAAIYGDTSAGAFVVGQTYSISTLGTTNYVLVGAADNTLGRVFVATDVGTGTGTAKLVSITLTGLDPSTPAYYFSAHVASNIFSYYTQGVYSYPETQQSTVYAGDMPKSYGPPANPVPGQVYFDETQKLVFVWDNVSSSWEPTSPSNCLSNNFDPVPGQRGLPVGYPALGDFFYNTTERRLKSWTPNAIAPNYGAWSAVESEQGISMMDKQDVGTTLAPSARDNLIMVLKRQLGWPKVCVELDDGHFDIGVGNALSEIRRRTDSAYAKQYFFMQIQQFQDVYYLNDPSLGTDKIVDVIKIHRLNMLGLVNFAPDNIYAQQFLNQFYAPGVSYDMVSIHLISAMSELFELLFAGNVAFNWREATREMKIYKKFGTPEKVLIECSCEKTEQELIGDRWISQWIQQWARSELMMMLGQIRGKYQNLPGPGGGLALNGDMLMQEGIRLQEDCLRQIQDFEVGQNGPDNFYLPFMVG